MVSSRLSRRSLVPALAPFVWLACAASAPAQDAVIFSLSGNATAPFGPLNDSELACHDPATGTTRPWLMDATGAFYNGDVNGDGLVDLWKDVDALWVSENRGQVVDVWLSFNTTVGSFKDGDVVRLKETGELELVYSEKQLMQAFGLTDGQMDVDGLTVDGNGVVYVSFDSDEASNLLSTDKPNVVTDGSVVWWNPATNQVGVLYTEGQIDSLVTHALGKSTKSGDTRDFAFDSSGAFCFCVQSPSSDDATVFSDANGGTVYVKESALGCGAVEMDALDLQAAPIDYPVARASAQAVPANSVLTVDLDETAANDLCVLLLSATVDDTRAYPFNGFMGLALDPTDPLFVYSLQDTWTYGTTDSSGHCTITFPAAPAGIVLTLFAQPYDFTTHRVGTPIAVDFTG
jgi:hypothetical protein